MTLAADDDIFMLLPFIVVIQTIVFPLGGYCVVRYDPRIIIAISSSVGLLGVLLCSLMTTFWPLFFCYSVCLGIMLGTAYIVPVHLCWDWFPNNKGLATGIVLGGFGFGSFIFGFISRALVNPNGLDLVNGRYAIEVTDRVPFMLRMLVIIWACIVAIALCLISPAPNAHHEEKQESATAINAEEDKKEGLNEKLLDNENKDADTTDANVPSPLIQCLTSRQFLLVYTMMLLSVFLGFYVAGVYKLYGNSVLKDDAFMTMVGSFAFIFGAIRFVWSWLVDLYSYKFSYTIILVIQSFLALTLVAISESYVCYFIWICVLIWLEGGHFVLLPTITAKLFPDHRAAVYSYAFSLNGMANLLAIILIRFTLASVGFSFYFYVGGIFSIVSLLLLVFLF